MKTKIILFAMAAIGSATSAFAHDWGWRPYPTAADSWETIRADRRAEIQQGGYAGAFGGDGYFNACSDGVNLRSIAPVRACAEYALSEPVWDGGGEGGGGYSRSEVCVRYEDREVVIPRHQSESYCAEYAHVFSGGGEGGGSNYECIRWAERPVLLPTTVRLGVVFYQGAGGAEGPGPEIASHFNKDLMLPACR